MISWQTSKSGVEIPIVNGNVLASRYDPRKEALLYLKPFELAFQNKETVFVLGAGNACVVQELLNTYRIPFVIVMDSNADLIQAMSQRHSHDCVQWVHVSSFEVVEVMTPLKKYFLTQFKVLVSPSAQFIDPTWVQSGQAFLNGHCISGFQFQKELRNLGEGAPAFHLISDQDRGPFGKLKALEMIKEARRMASTDELTKILGELVV